MKMQWGIRGVDNKGRSFFIDVVADSKVGARTQAVLCKGYGTLVTEITGPTHVSKSVRKRGAAPCKHRS